MIKEFLPYNVVRVDDIFDTGCTINQLAEIILEKGIPRQDAKIAVPDYKICEYRSERLPIEPDYSCRGHVIKDPAEEIWIHYMSHELVGLSESELEAKYIAEDP